jgi:SNF2 family DNA or RNA helicase
MAEEWAASGKKALVFSQFATLLRILQIDLQKIGIEPLYLDGSVPAKERGEIVRQFQEEDKPHLFLLSLKAGGVGLNLTSAQSAVLLEPWWNEAVELQAIDRAHRIGQKNTLWVHRLLTPNAIEEKMLNVKGRKMAFAEEILSGTGEAWSSDDLEVLLGITSHHS